MLIPRFNNILIRMGSEDLITDEVIGEVFLEWDEFKSRSDYRDLLLEWMIGRDLADLPPPPPVEIKQETPEEAPAQEGEGPQEFGGDYGEISDLGNETDSEESSESAGAGEEDEVPELQDVDQAPRISKEEGSTLP